MIVKYKTKETTKFSFNNDKKQNQFICASRGCNIKNNKIKTD